MKIESLSPEDLTKHKNFDIMDESAESVDCFCVTSISPAVRDENRVNVSIDGKFFCSLDISQLYDIKIKTGQKLNQDELANLKKASDFGKMYVRALEYTLSRPHSVREATDYLRKKTQSRLVRRKNYKTNVYETVRKEGYDKSLIEPVKNRLIEKGYLDDEKFARFWVENRFSKKGVSRRRLEQELTQKGVSRDIIENVLSETKRDDLNEMMKVIAKKRSKYDDDKLIQYLVRQGFDYDSAKTAVREKD